MNPEQNRTNFNCESKTVQICDLSPMIMDAVIVGIVITKQDVRSVQTKRKPGVERYVLGFTLRDSPNDTINITCWGDEHDVRKICNKFQIMDVVQIKNPQIQLKHSASSDDRYRPDVNSPFHLNISAKHSEVNVYFEAQEKLNYLIHFPTKFNQYYSLADIINNGQNFEGEHINLLVGVKSLGIPQNITTKDGRNLRKANLIVFDQTCSSFTVFIWEEAIINFSQKWNPLKCVLFISDIKINYNKHMKEMTGTVDGLTILTPNPDIQEAYSLYKYAQVIEFEIENNNDLCLNEESTSHENTIYSIEEIQKILAMGCDISLMGNVQGIVYAMISKLDLDGFSRLISFRCKQCKQRLSSQERNCSNMKCNMGNGLEKTVSEESFDINIWLSDYTGTLRKCYIFGDIAEKILNCTVDEFSYLSENEKTSMKWKVLLEWYKIHFKIVASSSGNPLFFIVSCQISNCVESIKHII